MNRAVGTAPVCEGHLVADQPPVVAVTVVSTSWLVAPFSTARSARLFTAGALKLVAFTPVVAV